MLRRQFVRENPETVREALERRGIDDVDLDGILALDEEWRELKSRGDDLRHERNQVSSRIGELKREGEEEQAQEAIERSGELKDELESIEQRADELEDELEARLLELPNVPHDDIPEGDDELDNEEVRRVNFDDLREFPEEVV
ncbi:serine--tRNA ligase, partial [Halobacteriales archaeon QH_7_66_37]